MNRFLKKMFIIAAVLIMASVSISVSATALDAEECTECRKSDSGLICSINEQYILKEIFPTTPLTFEAVFSAEKETLKDTTTILGSEGSFYPAIYFALNRSGQPRVMIRDKTHYSRKYTYTFNNVDVATGERIHLAIVMDFAGKKLHCYIDGELMQTLTGIASITPYKDKYNMIIGGDYDRSNATCFTGEIESIAMWSDMRTDEEVKSDFTDGVSAADENLLACYDFTRCDGCMVEDLSSNDVDLEHVVLWQEKEKLEPVTNYKYSFAVVGDTQKMCANDPGAMSAVYDWILANRESQKIEYVVGLGDITDNSTDEEWEFSRETVGKLNDKIPYILVRGNHDEWDDFNRHLHDGYYDKSLDGLMNEGDIDLSDPVGQPGVLKKVASDGTVSYITRMGDIPRGGIVKGDLTNSYQCVNVQGADYIFITLDFAPNEAVLRWVDSVLDAHPGHKAVIVTHAYMFHDGTTIGLGDSTPPSKYDGYTNAQNGEDIWAKCLKKHENVMMVLSGHDPWQHIVYRQDEGDNGNLVTQMLINPQGLDAYLGATGMVAMFYFSEDGETLTVRYYSVAKDCYGSELSQFTVHLNHDYKKVSETKSTCTEKGRIINKCSCGKEIITEIEKLPHKEVAVPGIDATCTKTGLTEGKKCSVCGTVTVEQETVDKKEHSYTTTVIAATCSKKGRVVNKCSCGKEIITGLEKLSHSYKTITTKATLTKNGCQIEKCTRCGSAKSTKTIYFPKTIKLENTEYVYDKKTKEPVVTVKDSKKKVLEEGADYTVSYEKGRKLPGRYTVKITFKGKYSGVKRLYFLISPKATSKIIAAQTTKTITLKWNKVTEADGYRVYKYNSKSKKYEKLKDVKKNTLKISKLKAGTAYRYKVRAYVKDDGVIWGRYSEVFETATKCAAPEIKKITTTKGKVSLTWSDVSGESGYQVYYSGEKDSGYKKAGSCKANVVKGSKKKLKSGKKYYFKLRAYKKTASGTVYSSWSAAKSIKVR